jgi:hypothetical protein
LPNSTSTVTFTATHTSTVQLAAPNVLGFPPEIFALIIWAAVVVIFLFFRLQVKGVPSVLLWIYKTGSALQFRIHQDLNGLFITVLSARGKKLETLTQGAEPLEVTVMPDKVEFFIKPEDLGQVVDEEMKRMIEAKGFKIKEKRAGKKNKLKGYLVYNEPKLKRVLAYLDTSLGGLRHMRLFATFEGSGTTVDWMDRAKDFKPDTNVKTGIIHQEQSAAKGWLQLLADAAKGTFGAILLPLLAGGGLFGMAELLVLILTGHFK